MNFYAHTAELADGSRDSDESRWQRLEKHLRNVSVLTEKFAAPFGIAAEARLAGLLHDLGKYRDEFQAYLRGERSSSVETQHAIYGAAWAAEDQQSLLASALAVAGHHAGLHDCGELAGMFAKPSLRVGQIVPQLIQRLESEFGPLPPLPQPPPWIGNEVSSKNTFSTEFYTRLIFSCVVDADHDRCLTVGPSSALMPTDFFGKVMKQVPDEQEQLLRDMMRLGLVKSFAHSQTTGRWMITYAPKGRQFLNTLKAAARRKPERYVARLLALGMLADGEAALGGYANK